MKWDICISMNIAPIVIYKNGQLKTFSPLSSTTWKDGAFDALALATVPEPTTKLNTALALLRSISSIALNNPAIDPCINDFH